MEHNGVTLLNKWVAIAWRVMAALIWFGVFVFGVYYAQTDFTKECQNKRNMPTDTEALIKTLHKDFGAGGLFVVTAWVGSALAFLLVFLLAFAELDWRPKGARRWILGVCHELSLGGVLVAGMLITETLSTTLALGRRICFETPKAFFVVPLVFTIGQPLGALLLQTSTSYMLSSRLEAYYSVGGSVASTAFRFVAYGGICVASFWEYAHRHTFPIAKDGHEETLGQDFPRLFHPITLTTGIVSGALCLLLALSRLSFVLSRRTGAFGDSVQRMKTAFFTLVVISGNLLLAFCAGIHITLIHSASLKSELHNPSINPLEDRFAFSTYQKILPGLVAGCTLLVTALMVFDVAHETANPGASIVTEYEAQGQARARAKANNRVNARGLPQPLEGLDFVQERREEHATAAPMLRSGAHLIGSSTTQRGEASVVNGSRFDGAATLAFRRGATYVSGGGNSSNMQRGD